MRKNPQFVEYLVRQLTIIYRTDCEIGSGVSSLSVWLYGIPTLVTATSEVFINVTAYGVAYSRAPQNMKGFVMALSLFMNAITTAISLATANAIQDPYLVWVFAAPSAIGFVSAFIFWFLFKHLDDEEFFVHFEAGAQILSRISDEEHSSIAEKHLDRGISEKNPGAGTDEVKL
jgi:dipeptide/tripeptide permease